MTTATITAFAIPVGVGVLAQVGVDPAWAGLVDKSLTIAFMSLVIFWLQRENTRITIQALTASMAAVAATAQATENASKATLLASNIAASAMATLAEKMGGASK